MSNNDASDPASEARHIARDWVLRLASGELDDEALGRLRAWRSADVAHNAAFEAERRLFRSLGPLEAAFTTEPAQSFSEARRPRVRRPIMVSGLGVAAALVAVWLAVDPVIWLRADRVTAPGEIAELVLPDGSRALLNSESAIDVDFDGRERRVHLLRGEAWFDVAHDAGHPFVVEARGATARAIGTAYSVRRHDNGDVSLAVTEGVVGFAGGGDDESLLVKAGRTTQVEGAGDAPDYLITRPEDALAWRSGRIVIENRSLADVASELSRYRRGSIFVMGSAASRRVSGVLQVGAIDKGLEGLAAAQGLSITHVTPWVIILR